MLPEVIVLGAQKAGTTSLFGYLEQHPDLYPSVKKEVHYFDGGLSRSKQNYARGPRWYRAHFPLALQLGARQKAFEASPLYLFNPLVPARIHAQIPDARLIAVLRNPTDRAISHYFHAHGRGQDPLPIDEAMRAEEERMADVLRRQDYLSETFMRQSYKARGRYHEQLARYLALFPREQLLVLNSDDLLREPAPTMRGVFAFAGVDPDVPVPDLRRRHVSGNKGDVPAETRAYLDAYFEPHNEALFELIGERYDW